MIFTRFLCVATLAVQSLAMSFEHLEGLIKQLAPNADNLAEYLRNHNAQFFAVPPLQAEACLGPILHQANRALDKLPPAGTHVPSEDTIQAAYFAQHRISDAIRVLDIALITDHDCDQNREASENVEFWIAKYTMERLCERLTPTQEVKRKVTACLLNTYQY